MVVWLLMGFLGNFRCFTVQGFQGLGFSGFRVFRVQGFWGFAISGFRGFLRFMVLRV